MHNDLHLSAVVLAAGAGESEERQGQKMAGRPPQPSEHRMLATRLCQKAGDGRGLARQSQQAC